MDFLDEEEESLAVAGKDIESRSALLPKEKEETSKMKLELQETLDALEDKKKRIDCAREKLETVKSETNELSVPEITLKGEVDTLRTQKLKLRAEEDRLKAEKAKLEAEWELIDEKTEELRSQVECVAEETEAVSRLLKDECDNPRLEKEAVKKSTLWEETAQELEQVALEMKKLDTARMEINLDCEPREGEWALLNKSIEKLKERTVKLEKQRELLRKEREEECAQIESLNKLEDLKLELDNLEVAKMQLSNMESSQRKILEVRSMELHTSRNQDTDLVLHKRINTSNNEEGLTLPFAQKPDVASPPNSGRLSWIKHCAKLIFKSGETAPPWKSEEKSSDRENVSLTYVVGKSETSNGYHGPNSNS